MPSAENQTVYVVQADNSKDFSDARRFGNLKAVFGRPRKPYDTKYLITKARRVFKDWKDGDYLLMIGDPTLCAVCMSIVSEEFEIVNVLSWDRDSFKYVPQEWDFGQLELDFGETDD